MPISKRKNLFFILLAQILLVKFLSNNLLFVNNLYPIFFLKLNFIQRKLFSFFSFDVGNIIYFLAFFFGIYFLLKSIKAKKVIYSILAGINILFFFFFFTWGFNYYNVEIEKKYFTNEISDKKIIQLTEYIFNKTVFYSKFSNRNSKENYEIPNKNILYSEILEAQHKTKILSNKTIHNQINVKPSIFSEYLSYLGVGGVYNPLTSEAIYNKNMPDIKLPFTISHEMSHQLGFASEAEANFIGFLVGLNVENNSIKYAIYYAALKYAMFCLYERAPILYPFYLSRFNKQMKTDYQQEKEYFLKYDSQAETYFSYSNDVFLKLNNQKEGVNSYQKFIYMLVNYLAL